MEQETNEEGYIYKLKRSVITCSQIGFEYVLGMLICGEGVECTGFEKRNYIALKQ